MTSARRTHRAQTAHALTPPPGSARLWLFVLVVCLPLVFSAAAFALAPLTQDLPQAATATPATAAALTLTSIAVLTLLLWAFLAAFLSRQSLRLDTQVVTVRSSFFRSQVPLAQLRLDQARVIDLAEHVELRPMLKVRGYSLPGFRSGWYSLRNKRKAFVATSDSRLLLWLPGRAGHDLLLDTRDPYGLLTQLRTLAATVSAR